MKMTKRGGRRSKAGGHHQEGEVLRRGRPLQDKKMTMQRISNWSTFPHKVPEDPFSPSIPRYASWANRDGYVEEERDEERGR
jgi:hypothetical protein